MPQHRHAAATAIALAACAFAVPALGDGNTIEMQLTPAGSFKPSDGRAMKVPAWRIDQAIATRVIERFRARRNPPVVDYEHQTLHKEANGQPAPAAAWIRDLQWREGSGLWATVELTARAAEHIRAGEYRFVSPVFAYDAGTGEVLAVQMAALTNHAAIDGMEPLALRAAATFGFTDSTDPAEDFSMNKLLIAICAALALDAEKTTEDQAIAACAALKPKLDALDAIAKDLGLSATDTDGGLADAAIAACTALRTAAADKAPDPSKFVAVGVVEALKQDLAALTAKTVDREVAEQVDAGLADGRLLEAQKAWATDLGKKDFAALTAYLASAQPIAALRDTQTGGRQPAGGKDENGLTADEIAVCTATGIDPKDFAAARA